MVAGCVGAVVSLEVADAAEWAESVRGSEGVGKAALPVVGA